MERKCVHAREASGTNSAIIKISLSGEAEMLKRLLRRVADRTGATRILRKRLYPSHANFQANYPSLGESPIASLLRECEAHNVEFISVDEETGDAYLHKDGCLIPTSLTYPWIVQEVFFLNLYFIPPPYLKGNRYTVIDVGMNRGYTAIYFASQPWCDAVYGFELVETTYLSAVDTLRANPHLASKVVAHNFGLSHETAEVTALHLPHRDGISSMHERFLQYYAPEESARVSRVKCNVRQASVALKDLEIPNSERLVMKIDVEGAEYDILSELAANAPEILERVDVLIGEAHFGLAPLLPLLAPLGFRSVPRAQQNKITEEFLLVR